MRWLLCVMALTACDEESAVSDLATAIADLRVEAVDGGINCGSAICALGATAVVCCLEADHSFCAPPSACSAGLPAYCDGPEDCAGGVCCHFGPSLISCSMQCTGDVVCHVDGDCPQSSPRCCATPAGYRACAAACS